MIRTSLAALVAGLASCAGATALAQPPYDSGIPQMPYHYGNNPYGGTYAPALHSPPRPGMTPIRQYPHLNAPLYPSPRQDIPAQVGGTMIPHQALAPHEMLYAHEYKGLYAPYYYRVKGHWLWTPFGIESHDKWELMGTEVKVKYRSNYSLLSGFIPPYNP